MAKKRWKRKQIKNCYQCDQKATTEEHVPPRSFFLDNQRTNLIAVPSCPKHNNYFSGDVEYVRNVLVIADGVNETGQRLIEKAWKSFENSPKLQANTLKDIQLVKIRGENSLSFQVDLERLKRVMRSIGYALHYMEFEQQYAHSWNVYCSSLNSEKYELVGIPDPQNTVIRESLERLPVVYRHTNYPDVFQYALLRESPDDLAYKLIFYGGVIFYLIGVKKPYTNP